MGGSTYAVARPGPDLGRANPRQRSQRYFPGARSSQARQGPEEDAVFTGIVEELGEVAAIEADGGGARIRIRGPLVSADAGRGDSIAINGVCLTVTATADGEFSADIMGETLARSSLGALAPGAAVNLERPLRPDGRFGGHIVQGHVDGTGTIVARQSAGTWQTVRISIQPELARYVVEKGSVAVDGISLTVSALGDGPDAPWFEVSLIPETLARTTLGRSQPGEVVNLEVDMIAKYIERLLASTGQPAGGSL
jgi:riboflavin synthase